METKSIDNVVIAASVDDSTTFLTQKFNKQLKLKGTKKSSTLPPANTHGFLNATQSTILLKKKSELQEVDSDFEKMKLEYRTRISECESRRLVLEEKQSKMRDQVHKFEKFVQENDAKMKRAEAKVIAERKMFIEKVKQIKLMTDQIADLSETLKMVKKQLAKTMPYKEYLMGIVESSENDYEEMEEIMARYQTLRDARNDLMLLSEKKNDEILERRKAYNHLRATTQNHLLIQNGILNTYRAEYEYLLSQYKIEQEESEKVEDWKRDTVRDYSQINQAIRNICSRCVVATMTATSVNSSAMHAITKANSNDATTIAKSHNSKTQSSSSSQLHHEKEKLMLLLDVIQNKLVDLQEIKNEYTAIATAGASSNSNNNSSNLIKKQLQQQQQGIERASMVSAATGATSISNNAP